MKFPKTSKRIRIWLALFIVGVAAALLMKSSNDAAGCAGLVGLLLAIVAGIALCLIAFVGAFRAIVRRLTLRLAFSYFLIGIVPIPLLAALLFAGAYLVAHQIVATRVHEQARQLAREDAASEPDMPAFRIDAAGKVVQSDVPWLAIDSDAKWAMKLDGPKPVLEGDRAWMAVPEDGRIRLVLMTDPDKSWAHRLSKASGYDVYLEPGSSRQEGRGLTIGFTDGKKEKKAEAAPSRAPSRWQGIADSSASKLVGGGSWFDKKWIGAVYIDPAVASFGRDPSGRQVVIYFGRTSPRVVAGQLFDQGIPAVSRVLWGIVAAIGGALLIVYLVALGIAFTLVGSIARNVNRLTRASQAISRGDFSVRVKSRSRDQIGDLARSFDGMAASIEDLLVQTAKKQRLETEIALARTIQQKLMPPGDVELAGLSVLSRFEPLAEIGGDFYDAGRASDGRSTVAIGDVSGHGLSTGLLVAMAKAGLSTLLESEHQGTDLFIKLNDLIHRSTDSRNYMTLALFAYDPATREGTLTNAGQLAPYRISAGTVDSLSLPSFPLGISPRSDFPTRTWQFEPGDRLVLLTDGWIEAADPEGEPFGFERFEAILRAEAKSEAVRIQEAVISAVAAHARAAPAEDDRTLLIVTLT